MFSIFKKEVNLFLSSLIGYLSVAVFLLATGLFLWVFPDYSVIDFGYSSLEPFFRMAPYIFLFLIPAITMRSFAEEQQTGTMELLATRPISDWEIILGKYLACVFLVLLAILPTFVYFHRLCKRSVEFSMSCEDRHSGPFVHAQLLDGIGKFILQQIDRWIDGLHPGVIHIVGSCSFYQRNNLLFLFVTNNCIGKGKHGFFFGATSA